MSEVSYESHGRVALITIDRAQKKNTLTKQVVDKLNAAWLRFNASDDRVAVLTGAGADLGDIPHDLWRAVPGIGSRASLGSACFQPFVRTLMALAGFVCRASLSVFGRRPWAWISTQVWCPP